MYALCGKDSHSLMNKVDFVMSYLCWIGSKKQLSNYKLSIVETNYYVGQFSSRCLHYTQRDWDFELKKGIAYLALVGEIFDQGSHSSWKIIEIQICFQIMENHWISWKVLEICKNEKIMEKSLNFGSVTHGKVIEFWNRHSFDWLHGYINMYFTYTLFTDILVIKSSKETLHIFWKKRNTQWMVIRCVRRSCVTCGPVGFRFVTFRIIMEIWDFCLEASLKNHWNFLRLVCGNPVDVFFEFKVWSVLKIRHFCVVNNIFNFGIYYGGTRIVIRGTLLFTRLVKEITYWIFWLSTIVCRLITIFLMYFF